MTDSCMQHQVTWCIHSHLYAAPGHFLGAVLTVVLGRVECELLGLADVVARDHHLGTELLAPLHLTTTSGHARVTSRQWIYHRDRYGVISIMIIIIIITTLAPNFLQRST
jgi:hypothetical protein